MDTPPQMYNLIAGGQASANATDDRRKPMRFFGKVKILVCFGRSSLAVS